MPFINRQLFKNQIIPDQTAKQNTRSTTVKWEKTV
nr:MAG TPA: hypothetical protein [Caudoviricetes sp.]